MVCVYTWESWLHGSWHSFRGSNVTPRETRELEGSSGGRNLSDRHPLIGNWPPLLLPDHAPYGGTKGVTGLVGAPRQALDSAMKIGLNIENRWHGASEADRYPKP